MLLQIGAEGHVAMMRKAAPGLMEYQVGERKE